MRLHIISAALLAVLHILAPSAEAQRKVNVGFDTCGALVSKKGYFEDIATSSPFVFSHVSVRGDCGALLYRFEQGELPRTSLTAGDICLVRATLETRDGKRLPEKLVRIRNNNGRMIARARTGSSGKVSFRFRNRTSKTQYYVLIGPKTGTGSSRLGCYFYRNQSGCFGPVSVGAKVC